VGKQEKLVAEKGHSHMQPPSILFSKVGLMVADVSIESKTLEESIVVVSIEW
jgi:hypothetical protein